MPSSSAATRAATASMRWVIVASGSVGSTAGRAARSSSRRCRPTLVSPSRLRTPSALSSMVRAVASSWSRTRARPRPSSPGAGRPPTTASRRAASRAGRGGGPARPGACAGRRAGRRGRPSGPRCPPCARPSRRAGRRAARTAWPACPAATPRAHHRGDRDVLGVQLGHGLVEPLGQDADLGAVGQSESGCHVLSASSAARRAWISSSESKTCCCSLSRISAARLSMPRIRSNDMAVSALRGAQASCCTGRGAGQKIATRVDHPHGASPFGGSDPIGAVCGRGTAPGRRWR